MKHLLITLTIGAALAANATADGIPEPGIVFYGAVENSAHGNGRLTVGSLQWTVTATGRGPVTISVPLADVAGQYSYRIRIPFETTAGSAVAGPSSFILNSAATAYTHGTIVLNAGGGSHSVSIVGPSLAVFNMSSALRGVIQPLTLRVNAPGVMPQGAGGGGGLVRLAGIRPEGAGDSGEPIWPFQFTALGAHPEGGVMVEWTGAPKDRPYMLLRAQSVDAALSEYEVVRAFPASAAVSNSFWDTQTVNTRTYFYKLLAQ